MPSSASLTKAGFLTILSMGAVFLRVFKRHEQHTVMDWRSRRILLLLFIISSSSSSSSIGLSRSLQQLLGPMYVLLSRKVGAWSRHDLDLNSPWMMT